MKIQKLPVADSPATDPLEAIFATYYQINGFITSSNKWFWVHEEGKHQQGYQDIDILAISATETILVSVTANLDDKVRFDREGVFRADMLQKLVSFYDRAAGYLENVPQYRWLLADGRVQKRILAYGVGDSLAQKIRGPLLDKNIQLLSSEAAIRQIQTAVREQTNHGLRTNNQLIKLLQYLPSQA